MTVLSEQERLVVSTIRKFVDDEVRPVVRELEHANTYPEKLIDQMKDLGVFGTAISGGVRRDSRVHRVLRLDHPAAGAGLD